MIYKFCPDKNKCPHIVLIKCETIYLCQIKWLAASAARDYHVLLELKVIFFVYQKEKSTVTLTYEFRMHQVCKQMS